MACKTAIQNVTDIILDFSGLLGSAILFCLIFYVLVDIVVILYQRIKKR
jgi:hypothetical protein